MKLNYSYIKEVCKSRSISVSQVLRDAGVSRTAFYSLLRQESLVPKSLLAISGTLAVPVEDLLEESPVKKVLRLQKKLESILDTNPELSRENVWHTLLLLEEPPVKRLDRGLIRGRKSVYPKRN
jgi:transcriptional regulator with XRE-family HTH domain